MVLHNTEYDSVLQHTSDRLLLHSCSTVLVVVVCQTLWNSVQRFKLSLFGVCMFGTDEASAEGRMHRGKALHHTSNQLGNHTCSQLAGL
jgi:uncharacterized membrane protein YiaA